jgi:hypothetical protein
MMANSESELKDGDEMTRERTGHVGRGGYIKGAGSAKIIRCHLQSRLFLWSRFATGFWRTILNLIESAFMARLRTWNSLSLCNFGSRRLRDGRRRRGWSRVGF